MLLAEMIGLVANRLKQLEVEARCTAVPHERSEERQNHRNGYREHEGERVELEVP